MIKKIVIFIAINCVLNSVSYGINSDMKNFITTLKFGSNIKDVKLSYPKGEDLNQQYAGFICSYKVSNLNINFVPYFTKFCFADGNLKQIIIEPVRNMSKAKALENFDIIGNLFNINFGSLKMIKSQTVFNSNNDEVQDIKEIIRYFSNNELTIFYFAVGDIVKFKIIFKILDKKQLLKKNN